MDDCMVIFTRDDIESIDEPIHPDEMDDPPWEEYVYEDADDRWDDLAETLDIEPTEHWREEMKQGRNREAWFRDQDIVTTLLVGSPHVTAVDLLGDSEGPSVERVHVYTDFDIPIPEDKLEDSQLAQVFGEAWWDLHDLISSSQYRTQDKRIHEGQLLVVLGEPIDPEKKAGWLTYSKAELAGKE